MTTLVDRLDTEERARLFDAIERAAAQLGLAMFVVHIDARPPSVVYASPLLATLLGRSVEDLVGKPPWAVLGPDDQRARVQALLATRGPGAPPLSVELEVERPDGTRRSVEVGLARVPTAAAELTVGYFRDVTGERATVGALRQSEARFRSLIDHAPDGVVIIDRGMIVLANPVGARMLGGSDAELRGKPIADFLPPEDAARARERMGLISAGADLGPSVYRVVSDQDRFVEIHSIPIEWEGRPVLLAFARDVTERIKIEHELDRAARLAAVGTMAATVAHEVNNPLTYVQLSLQRLVRELADDGSVRPAALREHVANAMHGVERVATIVRDLRAFARDDDAQPGPVDVTWVIERALRMVEHDLRHRARLVRRYASEVPRVHAVAGRLEQVVVNLLINAIQAMPAGDPGVDRVEVAVDAVGGEVTIAVRDTGVGIGDADRDRVFDPFFTTKPLGEGTGLGLAVCKRIVETIGGRIELAAAPGGGTEVTVTLPAIAVPAAAARPVTEVVADRRRLRILVIDDEPLVRKVIRMTLAPHHDVVDAAGGDAGLALLAEQPFDVILCDLMMPGMSGREVHDLIRERHPGLEKRIVMITGGAFVPRLAEFLESIDNLKLYKPFTEDEVLSVVATAAAR